MKPSQTKPTAEQLAQWCREIIKASWLSFPHVDEVARALLERLEREQQGDYPVLFGCRWTDAEAEKLYGEYALRIEEIQRAAREQAEPWIKKATDLRSTFTVLTMMVKP